VSDDGVIGEGPAAEFTRYWLARRPDLDPDALALAMTLARAFLLDMKNVSAIAERHGLTSTDYSLMATIQRGRREGPIRPSDLSRMFNLPRSLVTYRIGQLEQRGLVARTPGADRRVVQLGLTATGAEGVDAIVTEIAARAAERMGALDAFPGGRTTLQRLLSALIQRWEQLDHAPDETTAR
jgi:DNA-binding MarR family transcriptional regulator